jgi:hypothetical protein
VHTMGCIPSTGGDSGVYPVSWSTGIWDKAGQDLHAANHSLQSGT